MIGLKKRKRDLYMLSGDVTVLIVGFFTSIYRNRGKWGEGSTVAFGDFEGTEDNKH